MPTIPTTPFGERSTEEEVSAGLDLAGMRALVTGAASGIGAETARVLALRGAAVTLAVRDVAAGRAVAAAIDAATAAPAPRVEPLDLADLDAVRGLVDRWEGPLHVLVANAGVMALPELRRTPAGHELQLATNHLGHFALATGLQPALAVEGGRVVAPRPPTASRRCSSTIRRSPSCPTTRSSPTGSRRPPTPCSPSRPTAGGPATASG
jgi:hypothetical protein